MATKSPIDLDSLTASELTALIAAAEGKRREKLAAAKSELLAEFEERAAALGISVDELLPGAAAEPSPRQRKQRKDAGNPVAAKYRGPHGEEWSGRGRRPAWLSKALADGKSVGDFLI
jgi:DNA-binding protein H-NS